MSTFPSRIIGSGLIDPSLLTPHPLNIWSHPAQQQRVVQASLELLGFVDAIIANTTTNHILNGHLRVELALRAHIPQIPVTWVTIAADEEPFVLVLFDRLGRMAVDDPTLVLDLIPELRFDQSDLDVLAQQWQTDAAGLFAEQAAAQRARELTQERVVIQIGPLRTDVDRQVYAQWANALTAMSGGDDSIAESLLVARLKVRSPDMS